MPTMEELIVELQKGVTDYNSKVDSRFDEFANNQKSIDDRLKTIELSKHARQGTVGF